MSLRGLRVLPFLLLTVIAVGCSAGRGIRKPSSDAASEQKGNASAREGHSEADVQRLSLAHAQFIEALRHDINGEPAAALEKLEAAFRLDPHDPLLALNLSRRHERMTNYDRSVEVLKQAVETNPDSEKLFVRLAGLYALQGRTNLALQAGEGAVQAAPDSLVGYQCLYAQRVRFGQPDEAWQILERAASVPQPGAEFLTDLAELYTSLGRQAPARAGECRLRSIQLLNDSAGLHPTNRTVILKIADGFYLFEEYAKALPLYEQLLEENAFSGLYRDSLRSKATAIYLHSGQRGKAAELLKATIADDPLNVPAYLQLSQIALDEKKYGEAAQCLKQVVTLRPDVETVYYDLAGLQLEADDAQGSLTTLEQARNRFAQNFRGEYLAAIAFTRLKNYAEALTHFTAAEIIAGASDTNRLGHVFYFQLGAAHERSGDVKGAEKSFLRCLELSPDYASALNYLGYMWADRGENLDRAKDMIERAIKQEPENEAYLDSLAWVLYRQGRVPEALELIQKAIQLSDEPDAEILDHMGEIYEKLGQVDKAIEAWKKSLSVEPRDSVRKKLEAAQGQ